MKKLFAFIAMSVFALWFASPLLAQGGPAAPLDYNPQDVGMTCQDDSGWQRNPAYEAQQHSLANRAKVVGSTVLSIFGAKAAASGSTQMVNGAVGGASAGIDQIHTGGNVPQVIYVKHQTCTDNQTRNVLPDDVVADRVAQARRIAAERATPQAQARADAQANIVRPNGPVQILTKAEAQRFMGDPHFFPQYAGNGLWTMVNPATGRKVTGSQEQLSDMIQVHNGRCVDHALDPSAPREPNCD